MLYFIKAYWEYIFGPQSYEIKLRGSKNPKILKLLSTTEKIRFAVFPIAFVIWAAGFIIEFIITVLDQVSRLLHFLFEAINDSLWMPVSWFNLDDNELDNEVIKLTNEKP